MVETKSDILLPSNTQNNTQSQERKANGNIKAVIALAIKDNGMVELLKKVSVDDKNFEIKPEEFPVLDRVLQDFALSRVMEPVIRIIIENILAGIPKAINEGLQKAITNAMIISQSANKFNKKG